MEKRNVPEIRFKGFEDEWRTKPFNDISYRITEKSDDSKLPRVEFEDIKSGYGYLITDIYMKDNKNKQGIVFNNYDVLYGKLRPYLKNWLLPNFKGVAVGDFWVLRNFPSSYTKFIYYLIQTEKFNKVANVSIGSKMPRADWNLVSNTFFGVPSTNEQKKIGKLFICLDKKLELEKEKHKKLKDFKKSMLEKMFPKEGESIPKLRFDGFEGDWKIKVLEEIADRHDNLRIPVSENLRITGSTPYYGANGVQDYIEGFTHEGEFVLLAEDGANDVNNYPVHYVTGRIWVNNHAHVISGKPNICSTLFLKYAIKKTNISKVLVGGSRAKLNSQAMMRLNITLPAIEEQKQIGAFFKNLDKKIEASEEKIKKIEAFKKSLMEKMFV